MGRRIVMTDIHGCYYSFKNLLEQQVGLQKEDTLFLLGDYINKGPHSKMVLDYLLSLRESAFQVYMLRGNHEQELLHVYEGNKSLDNYLEKGGATLLSNFNVQHPAELPDPYIRFCRELSYFIVLPDFLLVHAGFDFNKENPFVPSEELLNIRDYAVDPGKTGGRPVIHGHSPTNLEQILKSLKQKDKLHYSLDAGCAYTGNPRQARLLALELNSWKVYCQPNIDPSDNYA